MSKKVLICEPNSRLGESYVEGLGNRGLAPVLALNGREAQALLAQGEFEAAVLNVQLSAFSALEVIKFVRFKNIRTKLILTASSQSVLEERLLDSRNLGKLGVEQCLIQPFAIERLEETIKGFALRRRGWREIAPGAPARQESEIKAYDEQFTSLRVEEFFCGNLAIFDMFIRLGRDRYLKILNQGESMEPGRLETYREDKGVEHLYFKTSDRKVYIDFLNHLIKKLNAKKEVGDETRLAFSETISRMMIQEIYTNGLDKEILEETLKVCERLQESLSSSSILKKIFLEQLAADDSLETHLYLTVIFSDAIAQNLEWTSERSRSKIMLGAMLHDVGKLKLPRNLRNKKSFELSSTALEEYQTHCARGAQLLEGAPGVDESVRLIVLQHHERVNGEGYPRGLAGSKTYPLAKIVGFADHVAELCVWLGCPPAMALKKMLEEKKEIFLFDPEVVKAFLRCCKVGM